jgi:crotonobetainyl-CoA:carnitine CoA-transferase CaiB-like acyl-CoA transferase
LADIGRSEALVSTASESSSLPTRPYAGRVLADLGAYVVKVGRPERRNEVHRAVLRGCTSPEGSLHFQHYSLGERSI